MNTYKEVAESTGMGLVMANRYINYMTMRWFDEEKLHCQTGYAREWALRFIYRIECTASDTKGQYILDNQREG